MSCIFCLVCCICAYLFYSNNCTEAGWVFQEDTALLKSNPVSHNKSQFCKLEDPILSVTLWKRLFSNRRRTTILLTSFEQFSNWSLNSCSIVAVLCAPMELVKNRNGFSFFPPTLLMIVSVVNIPLSSGKCQSPGRPSACFLILSYLMLVNFMRPWGLYLNWVLVNLFI